jgi:hypothetical protein
MAGSFLTAGVALDMSACAAGPVKPADRYTTKVAWRGPAGISEIASGLAGRPVAGREMIAD